MEAKLAAWLPNVVTLKTSLFKAHLKHFTW